MHLDILSGHLGTINVREPIGRRVIGGVKGGGIPLIRRACQCGIRGKRNAGQNLQLQNAGSQIPGISNLQMPDAVTFTNAIFHWLLEFSLYPELPCCGLISHILAWPTRLSD
jgi:hypothetical protein